MSSPGSPSPSPEGPPAVDPWKGLRGVMAATLVLEAFAVLLALLVVGKVGDGGGPLAVGVVLGLVVALVATTRLLRRPWGLGVALGLQVVTIAAGLVVPGLWVLGVVFGLIWVGLLWLRRDVARKMARGELPSQQG